MPTFVYKAKNARGETLRNRVEAGSKRLLVKLLKENNFTPIEVQQVAARVGKNVKNRKKNAELQEIMQNVNTTTIVRKTESTPLEKVKKYLAGVRRVTKRDLVVFTENFYLLKKANFNNIHALSTIIKTTENDTFRSVLEDILIGVESGENMYTTMEYYENIFPYLYINMIKVGELSGNLTTSLEQAVKYLDDTTALNKRIRKILIPNIIQFVGLLILLFVLVYLIQDLILL